MRVQSSIINNLRRNDLLLERRFRQMDGKYQTLITNKLIPLLQAYDIHIRPKPVVDRPMEQIYVGFDSEYNKISFIFTNGGSDLNANEHSKYDMFLTISYKGQREKVGVIDLTGKSDVSESFALITQALENMGFKLTRDLDEEPEEDEEDPDVKSLIDYKNSLSGD